MSTDHVLSEEPTSAAAPGMFTRQATGLVRNVTGRQSIALNFIAGTPTIGLSIGVFFALAGFPGGNLLLGILLTLPLTLAFTYTFGLMSAAIPRSGGDYVIVGRILHPALGLVSTACMMVAQVLSAATLALLTATLAIAPALTTVGLVGGSDTLVDWGTTVASSRGWQFGIAAVTLLGIGLV